MRKWGGDEIVLMGCLIDLFSLFIFDNLLDIYLFIIKLYIFWYKFRFILVLKSR